MSFEYMPSNEYYLSILLKEIQQYLRDCTLQCQTAYHDRITDSVITES